MAMGDAHVREGGDETHLLPGSPLQACAPPGSIALLSDCRSEPSPADTAQPSRLTRNIFQRGVPALSGLFSSPKCVAGTLGVLVFIVVILVVIISTPSYFHKSWEPCHEDWLYFKRKCYYLSEEEENWDSSQDFCSKHKAFLAVIENRKEMLFLIKRLQMQDSWIGLRKKGGSFYWEDTTLLQTDKFAIKGHAECAYIEADNIATSACSLPRRWICSYQPPS